MDYTQELEVARRAVCDAAIICRAVQGQISPDALQKKDRSPVTVADYASQALVCRALLDAFGDDPVIGEEDAATLRTPDGAAFLERVHAQLADFGAPSKDEVLGFIDHGGASEFSNRFWTLDPIDGTKGFLRGDQYAIALALVVEGQLTACALACPNLDNSAIDPSLTAGAVLWAVRGQGASWAPLDAPDDVRPAKVSTQADLALSRFCESVEASHSSHSHSAQAAERLGITAEPVRIDSQCKYGVVARGEAEVYLRLPTRKDYQEKIWDHGAGALLVAEAGGQVTDVKGAPLDFTHGRELVTNRGVIVTHGPFHSRVLSTLADLGVE